MTCHATRKTSSVSRIKKKLFGQSFTKLSSVIFKYSFQKFCPAPRTIQKRNHFWSSFVCPKNRLTAGNARREAGYQSEILQFSPPPPRSLSPPETNIVRRHQRRFKHLWKPNCERERPFPMEFIFHRLTGMRRLPEKLREVGREIGGAGNVIGPLTVFSPPTPPRRTRILITRLSTAGEPSQGSKRYQCVCVFVREANFRRGRNIPPCVNNPCGSSRRTFPRENLFFFFLLYRQWRSH